MTYRHYGFLIILIYQTVILQASEGNSLFAINHSGTPDLNYFTFKFHVSEKQDTVKFRTAASEHVVPDLPSDMVIQVGAFIRENNASGLKLKLSGLINQKVVILPANGFFKVRITGCQTYEEMGRLVEALLLLGINDVWIFRNLTKAETMIGDSVRSDTLIRAGIDTLSLTRISEQNNSVVSLQFNLQVGVFHSKAKAQRAKRRITAELNLPVKIVQEWEYYIVFVTGFKSREEIFRYYPKLAALGYTESFMVEKPTINPK
jgi:hypothetical protein